MDSRYITKDEFAQYVDDVSETIENYNSAFMDALESAKSLDKALNNHEKLLRRHGDMIIQLGESRYANRYLDWTGSGNPASPVNIGISTTYDKFNRKSAHTKSGCMTLIVCAVCAIMAAGLFLGG